jgi:hypothetical protein
MERNPYHRILAEHVARYPLLGIRDIYKLVYQGVMGSEHAVRDAAQVHAWLESEVASLRDGPVEPVIDPISKDGDIVRVNLRPYVAENRDLTVLNTAFVQTANEHRGTYEELEQFWLFAEYLAENGELTFTNHALHRFFEEMRELEFPSVHHSKGYTEAYKPAYRVVRHEFLGDSVSQ